MNAKRLREYRNMRFRLICKGQARILTSAEYQRMSAEFAEFVRGIDDSVKRQIILMYYHDVSSELRIADKLHYSVSQVKRMKRSAVHGVGEFFSSV